MATEQKLSGPDLGAGIDASSLRAGEKLLGHAGGEPVLLARLGDDFIAIGATCTHYGGPLAEGAIVGDTVRCPWHHACFSLRTGEALACPGALSGGVLARRAPRRSGRRHREGGARSARADLSDRASHTIDAAERRHRRRGRGGHRGGRDAAPVRVRRERHDRRRRRGRAVRPAEPLQGLPRRQRARGVDPAPAARIPRASIASRSCAAARRASTCPARRLEIEGRDALVVRRAAARDGRRAGAPEPPRRGHGRTCTTCARSPTAGESSRPRSRRSAPS